MSPYLPKEVEAPFYWCPNCKAWFQYGNVSCSVQHAPGDCCHMGERRFDVVLRSEGAKG